MDPKRIVIIGAGVAGWGVARALRHAARDGDVEVVLIDRRPYHEFPPLLYEVATGTARGREGDCEQILASGVCVNLHAYDRVLVGKGIRFIADDVVAIDRRTRNVRLRGGEEVPFDGLVLALGAETAYYGIAGLREHALPLKHTPDALRIRRCVLELLERAERGSVARANVVVGGGGATGVEFSAELAHTLDARVRRGTLRREDYAITLVEGGSRLLSAFPERLAREALQRLHRLGVRVLLDTRVQQVELGRVAVVPRPLAAGEDRQQLLCGFDGDSCALDADCVVWTGGIGYPTLPRDAGLPVDERGRVRIGEDFMIEGERCVFAVGDCAAFVSSRAKQPLPPLASYAVREAPVCARNALACIEVKPLRRFRPHVMPAVVPLGGRMGACTYRGWTWIGGFPWYLHSFVALQYFVGAFGVVRGIRIWWRGARVYVQND